MSKDPMARPYKATRWMEPIANDTDYVKVRTYKSVYYRQVLYHEIIPPFQAIDLGAIAAGAQSPKTNVTMLDLFMSEFGQWRWFPLDNMQVRLYLPSGVSKWALKNMNAGLDKSIVNRDPTLISTEFNSWQDERPAIEGLNFSGYALTAARIIVMGYRFVTGPIAEPSTLEALQKGQQACTLVDCAGYGGSNVPTV